MKQLVLLLIRLSLLIAPIIHVYVYATQGEGKSHDLEWWKANAAFILWAVGAYILLLLFTRSVIKWPQIIVLMAGSALTMAFYSYRAMYGYVLELPVFVESPKLVPLIPYAFVLLTIVMVRLLRPRHSSSGKTTAKIH